MGHPIMKFHCIIHQENLCAKISNSDLNQVMSTVTKIVLSEFSYRTFCSDTQTVSDFT